MSTSSDNDRRREPRDDPDRRRHHDVIYLLARAAETHDQDTGAHVVRIRKLVESIAERMNVEDAEDLGYDAMLHDVGKLLVPRAILAKPAALTPAEREIMASHTILGADLLAARETMHRAASIARSHHECWDGSGYPDGLAGERIPLAARITAVADVFDALVSDRVYKEAWSYHDALAELTELAGVKLDPAAVAALLACDAAGELEDILA
ncbi:MAG: HD domain-containing protein [Phycisphaerae bacterium]|nr:HD domain-containing protein [Phycisphaerae bacterium]